VKGASLSAVIGTSLPVLRPSAAIPGGVRGRFDGALGQEGGSFCAHGTSLRFTNATKTITTKFRFAGLNLRFLSVDCHLLSFFPSQPPRHGTMPFYVENKATRGDADDRQHIVGRLRDHPQQKKRQGERGLRAGRVGRAGAGPARLP